MTTTGAARLVAQTAGEHGEGVVASRRDGDLRELLAFHLGGADGAHPESEEERLTLVPALFCAYRELGSIRHDYPVVLLDDGSAAVVAPLAEILDERLRELVASRPDGESVRRDAYRLEARVKRLADGDPGRDLSTLWVTAAAQLLDETADAARRDGLRRNLEAARSAVTEDGPVLPCGPEAARRTIEHAWRRLRSEQDRRDGEILDELIGRLSDVLEAERALLPGAVSAAALRASMGDEHAGGIDFEALSSVLRRAGRTRQPPEGRMKRLRDALRAIRSERARLAGSEAGGRLPRSSMPGPAPAESCREALATWQAEVRRRVELVRAVRIATLELENRYREERHDAFFAGFGAEQLTLEERRALPPLLACLDADRLDDAERSALVEILVADMPLKIFLAVRDVPGAAGAAAAPDAFSEWPARIGAMAIALGEAFVIQTAASHLPGLAAEVTDALRHEGPALLAVYTGPARADGPVPAYLRCAGAVESRVFPSFVCDPGRGTDLASRLSLKGNPQADRPWPRHRFSYEDPDGQAVEEELAFTGADFLALDARFRQHLAVIPRERWHPRMVPLAEYLALSPDETADRVPYLHLADGSDRLHRAVVTRVLMAHARRCAANWERLQGLAGVHAARAIRLLEEERARLEEEKQRAIAALEAAAPGQGETGQPASVAPAAPTGQPDVRPGTLEPGPPATAGPDRDTAYIETAFCTTCNECTERNPGLFAYDGSRQAFIRDARAGTYRDLVEAAEICPVCIIHPGKPLDPGEPGLDELLERAAPFR